MRSLYIASALLVILASSATCLAAEGAAPPPPAVDVQAEDVTQQEAEIPTLPSGLHQYQQIVRGDLVRALSDLQQMRNMVKVSNTVIIRILC